MNKTVFVACVGMMFSALVQPAVAQWWGWPPSQPSTPPPSRPSPPPSTPPAGPCASGTGPMLLSIGQSIGEDVGYQLWDDVGESCFELDGFIEIVADVSSPGAGGSCLAKGFINGINDVVDDVADECVDECLDEGQALGEILGKTACEFGVDRLLDAPPLCSRIAQASCQVAFDGYIADHCPNDHDPDIAAFLREKCSEITP